MVMEAMVRKSMIGTPQTTMKSWDKGMKTWNRKMPEEYIAMDCTTKIKRILMTITMVMVTMNIIELKSNCIQRCNSQKAHLNSLNPLQRNYKIILEDDIERKLKEERSNIVEFFEKNEKILISSQSKNEAEVIDVTLALSHDFGTFLLDEWVH